MSKVDPERHDRVSCTESSPKSLFLFYSLFFSLLPGARISGVRKVDPERHDVLGQICMTKSSLYMNVSLSFLLSLYDFSFFYLEPGFPL